MKRKKWKEEEERSLIDKYAEMQSDGSLRHFPTREKRFRPIAAAVNAAHHAADPASYPFHWSWKDASTKVQNMRHQYLLVKQKLLSATANDSPSIVDWSHGLSLWPNFLRYKAVFGDAPLPPSNDNQILELGFGEADDEGFDYEDIAPPLQLPFKNNKKKKPAWACVEADLSRLREFEVRMEEREAERNRRRRQAEAEAEERARRRREEEMEWEERMQRRRAEWREGIEATLSQHRAEMENIHARILHDQQSIMGQLLGIVSHWTGAGLSDVNPTGTGIVGHHHHPHQHQHEHQHPQPPYLSQVMQNLHHMNGIIPEENREDGHEDQFIVDDDG